MKMHGPGNIKFKKITVLPHLLYSTHLLTRPLSFPKFTVALKGRRFNGIPMIKAKLWVM
jgi:hypothetical protein